MPVLICTYRDYTPSDRVQNSRITVGSDAYIHIHNLSFLMIPSISYITLIRKMGSCSNKSTQQGVPSIMTIVASNIVHPHPEAAESKEILVTEFKTEETKCNHNFLSVGPPLLFTPVQMIDESSARKSRKNLTVLTTNADNFEIPEEMGNERSIITLRSEGKLEQGSLYLVKEPITIGGRPSLGMQSNFEEKLILIQGADLKRDFLLEHGVWVCCKKGLKPESPNQDDFFVVFDNKLLTVTVPTVMRFLTTYIISCRISSYYTLPGWKIR